MLSWLEPYNNYKLQTKSKAPCVFLGYAQKKNTFIGLDISSNMIFVFHHVRFVKSSFSFDNFSLNTSTYKPCDRIISSVDLVNLVPVQLSLSTRCSNTLSFENYNVASLSSTMNDNISSIVNPEYSPMSTNTLGSSKHPDRPTLALVSHKHILVTASCPYSLHLM